MTLISSQPGSITLHNARKMPLAAGYLWNARMMLQINCQGYATAQFMQPEPASYTSAPVLQATTFMQPEQPVYAHHPGRFFYIKDEQSGAFFSIPFAPTKVPLDSFAFTVEDQTIRWKISHQNLLIYLSVTLDPQEFAEHWQLKINNVGDHVRQLSIYPYFPIGYRSWMNQSADYVPEMQAIVSDGITPYQKVTDYFTQRDFNELCFLMSESEPDSWEARQSQFEGELGLHQPAGVQMPLLERGDALYETPCAAIQFRRKLEPAQSARLRFAFGAAQSKDQLKQWRDSFFPATTGQASALPEAAYICAIQKLSTPDSEFDNFVNLWLPRQIQYHNDLHRLSTDPQTRNFLQDTMGLVFLDASKARSNLLLALSQQNTDGSMPDGILLHPQAKLKYINQVPHTDHGVWLAITVHCYLRETNDFELLNKRLPGLGDSPDQKSVFQRVCAAVDYLGAARDHRGLNFIGQGDWCDPMNMVGHQGRGVSIWLSLATAYAAKLWADICARFGDADLQTRYVNLAAECNAAVNKHGWDGQWYARGITDDGRTFGINADDQGKIFLNPQSWALLSGAADQQQQQCLVQSVDSHLNTPWGLELLNPPYTTMYEDIGRITQKFPGTAENGSVYNHAAAFYAYALYLYGEADAGFEVLKKMLPAGKDEDSIRRGQLANFIPNYYRGASHLHPRTAGRSSQLFHTGTVHWYLRCVIEGIFGLQGDFDQLLIQPKLPSHWNNARVERRFHGADFSVHLQRSADVDSTKVFLDEDELESPIISKIEAGRHYQLRVLLPTINGTDD